MEDLHLVKYLVRVSVRARGRVTVTVRARVRVEYLVRVELLVGLGLGQGQGQGQGHGRVLSSTLLARSLPPRDTSLRAWFFCVCLCTPSITL